MRRLVLVEKADSMVWTLALMGAVLLTVAEPGFHPSLVSSLARITGMKLILREEIELLFYRNAQMSNVYKKTGRIIKRLMFQMCLADLMMLPLRLWKLT